MTSPYLRWDAAWANLEHMKRHRSWSRAGGCSWRRLPGVSVVPNDAEGRAYLVNLIHKTKENGDGVVRGAIFEVDGEKIGICEDDQPVIKVTSCRKIARARDWYERALAAESQPGS